MKTLSKRDYKLFRRNNGHKAQFSVIKSKGSLEADVLAKDSVNVEAAEDEDGNQFFIFPF